MKRAIIGLWLVTALPTACEAAPDYRPEDASIRCTSNDDCRRLIGRKLWVAVNKNEICTTIQPSTGCKSIPINFGITVQDVASIGSGLLDHYFKVRAQDGSIGYINTVNAHLLTYTDPAPSIAAKKKRDEAEALKKAKQSQQDAAMIASTPKETFEKACILAAAERLPKIPGIQIKNSKGGPLPKRGQTRCRRPVSRYRRNRRNGRRPRGNLHFRLRNRCPNAGHRGSCLTEVRSPRRVARLLTNRSYVPLAAFAHLKA